MTSCLSKTLIGFLGYSRLVVLLESNVTEIRGHLSTISLRSSIGLSPRELTFHFGRALSPVLNSRSGTCLFNGFSHRREPRVTRHEKENPSQWGGLAVGQDCSFVPYGFGVRDRHVEAV